MPWSRSNRSELDIALEQEAEIVGINSRDLDTFTIDTEAAWRLLAAGAQRDDRRGGEWHGRARRTWSGLPRAGADAVLVGTALSGSPAPEQLLRELLRGPRHDR